MRFLVDANVLSEATRPQPDEAVLEWLGTNETEIVWARLLAELKRKGRAMPVKDSLLAATAKQHRLTVATRNTSDFRYAGVNVLNPFDR